MGSFWLILGISWKTLASAASEPEARPSGSTSGMIGAMAEILAANGHDPTSSKRRGATAANHRCSNCAVSPTEPVG